MKAKRSVNANVSKFYPDIVNINLVLNIFDCMCRLRYFEAGVIDAVEKGEIKYPMYLTTGQEAVGATLSMIVDDWLLFTQHRIFDLYLGLGCSPEMLRDELLGLETGTSGGRAGSNCIQYHKDGIHLFGHHGLIGENVPLAVGASLGMPDKKILCVFGDGSAEEDYIYPSLGFAVTHKLPILFVCVDNDLSILTKKEERRSWSITDVAESMGMLSVDIADDPLALHNVITNLAIPRLPALINCYVCRGLWHVGVNNDGPPEWNRFTLFKEFMHSKSLLLAYEIEAINKHEMENLWNRSLSLRL